MEENKRKKIRQKFANYALLIFFSKFSRNDLDFFHCGSRIRISIKIKWILSTCQGIYCILLVGFILENEDDIDSINWIQKKGV